MTLEDALSALLQFTGPELRIYYAPGHYEEVSRSFMEANEQALRDVLGALPPFLGWLELAPLVGNNGTKAKLLVALGDLLCVWKLTPPVSSPDLWGKSTMYPMVLGGHRTVTPYRNPDLFPCESCGKLMAVAGTPGAERTESNEVGYCRECVGEDGGEALDVDDYLRRMR